MSRRMWIMLFALGTTPLASLASVENYATVDSLEARLSDSMLEFSEPTWLTYSGLTGTLAGGDDARAIDDHRALIAVFLGTLNPPFADRS